MDMEWQREKKARSGKNDNVCWAYTVEKLYEKTRETSG
jgi:hypothetical protein